MYVDIAIIALIAIFALLGLWKGTAKTGIKLICFAVSIVVTWLVAGYVVKFVLGVGFLRKFIVGDEFSLAKAYYDSFGEEILGATEGTKLSGALGLYINTMIERFTALGGPASFDGLDYPHFISIMLAINTITIVLCFIIYLLVRIVAHILAWILKKLLVREGRSVRVWSRLVGFVFGGVRGAALVMVLLIASTVIFPFKFAAPYTETVGGGIISKFAATYTYKAFDAAIYGGKNTEKTLELMEVADHPFVSLDDKKADALADLDKYFAAFDSTKYSETNYGVLQTKKLAGAASITAAADYDSVMAAYDATVAALDDVLTKEEETSLRQAATVELSELFSSKNKAENYSSEHYIELVTAHSNGVMNIGSATTHTELNAALEAAKSAIEAIPTIVEEKRTAALAELKEKYLGLQATKNPEELLTAYDEGQQNIRAAENADDVQAALDDATAALDAVSDKTL